MDLFLDTEFIESGRHNPIQLISIAVVSEFGDDFYAISSEFNPHHANHWVRENVIKRLEPPDIVPRLSPDLIAQRLLWWVRMRTKEPKFYGWYSSYDWVVMAQLYGKMADLPPEFPMYCRDIKQICDDLGNPDLPKQERGEHNALADARWNREAYLYLKTKETNRWLLES